ncbi:MAG: hypothetical protein ABEJ36_02945 [Candidatus Nanosalina sp.]
MLIAKEEIAEEEIFVTAQKVQGILSYELDKDFTTTTIRNHGFSMHGHLPRKYDSIDFLLPLNSRNPTGSQCLWFDPEEFLKELEEKRPSLFT